MKKIIIASMFALSACGTQPTPTQIQSDLAEAKSILQTSGCVVEVTGTMAAPIIAVTSDAQGNKVLSATTAAGAALCQPVAAPTIKSGPGTVLQ